MFSIEIAGASTPKKFESLNAYPVILEVTNGMLDPFDAFFPLSGIGKTLKSEPVSKLPCPIGRVIESSKTIAGAFS